MVIYYISASPAILPQHKPIIEKIGEVNFITGKKMEESEFVDKILNAEILILAPSGFKNITKYTFDRLKDLKFITATTTGVDWMDLNAARAAGVIVSTCKGANAESVAEHNFGMIIDLSKRISEFDRDARFKNASDFTKYQGKELYGKTLGILGLGDIGLKVARIATAFNMNVLGFNRSQKDIPNVKQVDLNDLLKESDIISVNLPLTDETRDLIGSKEVFLMKNGVIIVNTAREEITTKSAIVDGIKCGKIFGFGIETAIMEALEPDDEYFKFSNVIVNPHNAFNTVEADINVKNTWVNNIVAFINGKPENIVT